MPLPEPRWVTALDGTHIVAVQHGCGAGGAPVNCALDENQNWFCPSCSEIYGAASPLAAWTCTPVPPEPEATP